ncbi:MAG: Gfo/Idh/MocA family oxidoreductase [Thermoguttaceae bacterium]|nr:Gfo/Idh/MocA family oxidoreductase [Thermoguttaceae bacterium]
MKKVRLGVIGTGRLGGFHSAKAADNPEVEFVGVTDASEENRKRVAERWNVREFANVDELLPNVDAAIVATPSVLHAEIGRKVLLAGKHLLVEKPATTSGQTAMELANLAKRNGLVMQAGHVEQYNPAWRAAQWFLQDVRSGRVPARIEATRTSGYTFRSTDVGATLDLMIHDLELVLSLVPSPVEDVIACGNALLGGFEDVSLATVLFENGSVARLKASRIETEAVRQMTIGAPDRSVFIDFAARSAKLSRPKRAILDGDYAPNKVSYSDMAPRVSTFMQDEFETEELVKDPVDALELELQDFVSAIVRGTQPAVPGERAAQAVVVAEAIVRDLEERGRRLSDLNSRTLKIAG